MASCGIRHSQDGREKRKGAGEAMNKKKKRLKNKDRRRTSKSHVGQCETASGAPGEEDQEGRKEEEGKTQETSA